MPPVPLVRGVGLVALASAAVGVAGLGRDPPDVLGERSEAAAAGLLDRRADVVARLAGLRGLPGNLLGGAVGRCGRSVGQLRILGNHWAHFTSEYPLGRIRLPLVFAMAERTATK